MPKGREAAEPRTQAHASQGAARSAGGTRKRSVAQRTELVRAFVDALRDILVDELRPTG